MNNNNKDNIEEKKKIINDISDILLKIDDIETRKEIMSKLLYITLPDFELNKKKK